jgi:RHS repeat-associated protein
MEASYHVSSGSLIPKYSGEDNAFIDNNGPAGACAGCLRHGHRCRKRTDSIPTTSSSPIAPPIHQTFTSPFATPASQTGGGATPLVADGSSDPDPGWKLLYNPPMPDLFSGAATFNYPIEVPPGRNGLQPKVNLVYSSRAVDGLLDILEVESGPIGLGWSLNLMDIVREGVNEGSDGAHKVMNFPNQFSLLIDGTGHELQPDTANASYGRYHARDLPGYYIERHNDWGGGGAPNTSHEYWTVRLPDGTSARLGYTPDSEQVTTWVICDSGTYCGVPGEWYQIAASRWRVDVVTDTFANTMVFSYTEATKNYPGDSKRLYSFQQSRPSEIDYNAISSGWASRVEFIHDNLSEPTGQIIDRIRIYHASQFIREYDLNHSWHTELDNCGQTVNVYALDSIQIANTVSLPATTFDYQPLAHWSNNCARYATLRRVANGYGAATEFSYASDGRKAGCYPTYLCGEAIGYSYVVTGVSAYDGLNSSPTRSQYAYSTRCYDQSDGTNTNGGVLCTGFGRIETYGPLVGHDVVTRTVLDFNGTGVSKDVHRYFTYTGNHPFRGREYSSQSLAPNNQPLALSSNTFVTMTNGATVFTYLSQADHSTYDGGITATQRITYTYDAYGNLKARFEHGDPSISGDERRTTWDYYPNTNASVWIVNKPAQESVYTGLTGPLASQTRNIYDNLPGYTSAPTRGALTRVDRWDGSTWIPATRTAYDAWGNPTVITNALGFTTTMTYDESYHLYAIAVTNALNQTTRTDYDLALGVPLAVTDPNSAVTNYRYDTFGRLLKIIKPGDSESIPTIEYQYSDAYSANNLHGLRVTQKLREVSSDANAYHSIYTFYDGTGRLVQTRAEAGDGSQQAVTNVVYDARGLTQFSYAPAFEPTSADYSSSAVWGAHPRAQTQYDALGRTIVVTSTDGTAARTAFSGRSVGVLDANGHQLISTVDAFGRLVAVKEYTSTAAAINFNAPAYATTTYAYDTLNNLVRVTDTLSNSTIIAYNRLGQKTVITDTDMGVWKYAYDLVGNLTRQMDARGQRVCFYYDPLNRLTGKQYRADDACPTLNPTLNVTYTYDSGVNGIGRRTGMIDDSGSATWIYDVRGRTIVDSRMVPGVRAFGLGYTYDALDRLTAITYPNGEVVTQTYNAGAQVVGLTGANPYVSGLTYNAQGQIKQMSLGNGATTTYDYYGDGGPAINSFRLWRINTVKSGNPLLDLQYGYDKVGNINRITDTVNSAQVSTFNYDALDRLTNAATTPVGNGQYSEGYTYNAIGNILSKGSAAYQYADPLHKHAVTTAGSNSYAYDANGNMLTRNEASVLYHQSWDAENRLQVVTNTVTGEVTRFVYDGDGARVQQIYSGTYTSTTIYLGAPAEINILGAPLPPPTSTIPPTMTYRAYLPLVMGGQPIPPRTQPFANETWKMYYAVNNQLVAMRSLTVTGSVLYYLHSDHLGSTSLASDANGAAVPDSRQMYYPYGELRVEGTSLPMDIGFTGQRKDATGLMYFRARYYSSGLGRFVSADSIIPDTKNPQAWNRFSYTANNPLKYTDPSGHCWGIFSFLRDVPLYSQICPTTDLAWKVVTDGNVSFGDRFLASIYVTFFGGSQVALAAGTAGLACSSIAPCAAAAGAAQAASADGDPTNEIQTIVRTLQSVDMSAVKQFVQDAIRINADRGLRSFNEWWSEMSQFMLDKGDTSRMFVAQQGDRIIGMMRVVYNQGIYQIKELEGIGQGGGTALFKQAIQDSLAKGFGGAVYLNPAEQALAWYLEHFPGAQTLPNGALYWSPEAAKAILGVQ